MSELDDKLQEFYNLLTIKKKKKKKKMYKEKEKKKTSLIIYIKGHTSS